MICLDCSAPLSPERAVDFVVCALCFEKRLARWVSQDPRPLEVQKRLIGGKTIDSLKTDLGINAYEHPRLPLVGLKYDMIASPRKHPVVRECRGIVLEKATWHCAAKPFNRFLNAGEDPEAFARFDWSNFSCTTKEDGSLIILYYYEGWRVNTSGSFGSGKVGFSDMTYEELFWEAVPDIQPSIGTTYVFELCSPYNKVVRLYPQPQLFLLGAFYGTQELPEAAVDEISREFKIPRPAQHQFSSMDEITQFLASMEASDKTFEGVVIRDHAQRFKIKTKTYLALHHLHDNGNLFDPKRLVPFLLKGEKEEMLAYFPEGKEAIERVEKDLDVAWRELEETWAANQGIENQKEFALKVKDTRFASILFSARKQKDLRAAWLNSEDMLIKRLYESR